jgi:hypothetical protein
LEQQNEYAPKACEARCNGGPEELNVIRYPFIKPSEIFGQFGAVAISNSAVRILWPPVV